MAVRVIGIGGVSRSGKSTLARKLEKAIHGTVLVLSQDDFTRPVDQIPTIRDRTDWEHPDSIDFQKLISEISIKSEHFDFILLEGLLAFTNEKLNSLYDHTILLTILKETFLARRKQESRWGKEPDWYLEHVWESYLKYGQYEAESVVYDWDGSVEEVLTSLPNLYL